MVLRSPWLWVVGIAGAAVALWMLPAILVIVFAEGPLFDPGGDECPDEAWELAANRELSHLIPPESTRIDLGPEPFSCSGGRTSFLASVQFANQSDRKALERSIDRNAAQYGWERESQNGCIAKTVRERLAYLGMFRAGEGHT